MSKEKVDFITQHEGEIKPLLSDPAEQKAAQHPHTASDEQLDGILEKYETKVFFLEKSPDDYDPGAKRVLLGAADPMDFSIIEPLIARLRHDRRCRYIGLVADNVAGQKFEKLLGEEGVDGEEIPWRQVQGGKIQVVGGGESYDAKHPVLNDVLLLNRQPGKKEEVMDMDTVITVLASKNSPMKALLHSAKVIFGAKKLLLAVGFSGLSGRSDIKDDAEVMAEVDAILCPVDLAKQVVQKQLPNFPEDRIVVTGTPELDEIRQAKHLAAEYAAKKMEMGIAEEAFVIAYLGDNSSDYGHFSDVNVRVNEITCERTVAAVVALAKENPNISYALVLRPHPRDPKAEEFMAQLGQEKPTNLVLLKGTDDTISMTELGYVADVIISVTSTQNFYAEARGKHSIFLGYKKDELGGNILAHEYDHETLTAIAESPGIAIADSPEQLKTILERQTQNIVQQPAKSNDAQVSLPQENYAVETILGLALGGKMIKKH